MSEPFTVEGSPMDLYMCMYVRCYQDLETYSEIYLLHFHVQLFIVIVFRSGLLLHHTARERDTHRTCIM